MRNVLELSDDEIIEEMKTAAERSQALYKELNRRLKKEQEAPNQNG